MSDKKFDPVTDRIILNLDRIHSKLDGLDARLDSIDKTLVRQGADLEYHIKRTTTVEEILNVLRGEVKSLQRYIHLTEAIAKVLAWVAAFVTFAAGIMKIFGVIK